MRQALSERMRPLSLVTAQERIAQSGPTDLPKTENCNRRSAPLFAGPISKMRMKRGCERKRYRTLTPAVAGDDCGGRRAAGAELPRLLGEMQYRWFR